MEAKKKALSNGWIDNVDHSYKYWSNQIDLRHIRELIRQKEWEKNNRLYLRRIKANSRGTAKMTISKTSLAIERHNLKNILVKLKAQDTLVNWLQNKIENLQKDNHENIIEEIQKWIIEGIEIRAERRKSVNEQLDSLPRVNP
jgi:hypothetical protein